MNTRTERFTQLAQEMIAQGERSRASMVAAEKAVADIRFVMNRAELAAAEFTRLVGLPPSSMGAELIAEERERQVSQEGWTPEHDDQHADGSMAMAAAVYAATAGDQAKGDMGPFTAPPDLWPWHEDWYKPRDQLRNLVRAGALIAAEIDRLHRKSLK